MSIDISDKQVGWLGEMKPEIYQQFNFKNRNVCLFELNFSEFVGAGLDLPVKKYKPLPQFPVVVRDLAFELEWNVKWQDISIVILAKIATGNSSLIQDPIIKEIIFLSEFDLGNKKSVAFRIIYQAERTLKDEEVEVVQKKIIKLVEEKFGGELRMILKQ